MGSKLVPWANWSQWDLVRSQLFSLDPWAPSRQHAQTQGINMVKAWRVRGKVPLSLDVTACLIEAQLLDEQLSCTVQQPGLPPVSQVMLRNMYSLPIIRLVNGIADAQQRGRTASSVSSLANFAGLPAILVDIRHAATHGDLPTLAQLRGACQAALSWLAAAYWDTQLSHLEATQSRLTQNLGSLMTSWQAAHSKSSAGGGQGEGAGSGEEDEQGEPQTSGVSYKSGEGKLLRRGLLSGVKSLLPPSWSCALVHPLIAALTQHTPSPPSQPLPAGPGNQLPASRAGSEVAGAQRKRRRDKAGGWQGGEETAGGAAGLPSKALTSCLLQVFKSYPHLGHQLLLACVLSLTSTCCQAAAHREAQQQRQQVDTAQAAQCGARAQKLAGLLAGLLWWPISVLPRPQQQDIPPGQTSGGMCAEHALRWLHLLLPEPPITSRGGCQSQDKGLSQQGASQGGGGGGGDVSGRGGSDVAAACPVAPVPPVPAPGVPLEVTAAQVVDMLSVAITGLTSGAGLDIVHPTLAQPTDSGDASAGQQDSGNTDEVAVARQALEWVVTRLSALLHHQLQSSKNNVASWGPGERSRAAVLSRLTQLASPPYAATLHKNQPTGGNTQEPSLDEAAARQAQLLQQCAEAANDTHTQGRRWKRATHWRPCAIGCLPSSWTPSGLTPWLSDVSHQVPEPLLIDSVGEGGQLEQPGGPALGMQGLDELMHTGDDAGGSTAFEHASMDVDGLDDDMAQEVQVGCKVGAAWLTVEQLQQASVHVRFL